MLKPVLAALLITLASAGCTSRPTARETPAPTAFTVGAAGVSHGCAPSCFTVGTYNVHDLQDPARIRADLARLSHVDVWCFQEIRVPDTADLPKATAERLEGVLPAGRWHCAAVAVNQLAELRSDDWEMQVVASRFPIKAADVWPLDEVSRKRRVALVATVAVHAAHDVTVVNTDHEPSFLALGNGNARQVDALVAKLETVPHSGRIVVAGDFNCSGRLVRLTGNGGNIRPLDHRFDRADFTSATPEEPTFHSAFLSLRLDLIYVRSLLVRNASIGAECTGSDHSRSGVTCPSRRNESQVAYVANQHAAT